MTLPVMGVTGNAFQLTHPSRGATTSCEQGCNGCVGFQLTHPSRGATACRGTRVYEICDFNSHTPRGVRLSPFCTKDAFSNFNSHTPRGVRRHARQQVFVIFLISTHTPLAGCDFKFFLYNITILIISTHTPLAGCDLLAGMLISISVNFNSHTPRGVRQETIRNIT